MIVEKFNNLNVCTIDEKFDEFTMSEVQGNVFLPQEWKSGLGVKIYL